MFVVYWTCYTAQSRQFSDNEMTGALQFAQQQRTNPENSFVCLCSENVNSVGKAGVADPSPDYDWKKRRA